MRGNFSGGCNDHRELFDLRGSNARLAQHVALRRPPPMLAPEPGARTQLFDPDDPAFSVNLAGNTAYADVEARLFDLLVRHFLSTEEKRQKKHKPQKQKRERERERERLG